MKFSNYTISVENYPEPGQYLLFNTRTQALVTIDQALKDIIDCFDSPQIFPQKAERGKDLAQLHEMGILVADEEEDRRKLRDFFDQLKYGRESDTFTAQILTTDACNFQCRYCFQESSRSSVALDIPTCDLIISWIKDRVEHLDYQEVYIIYYGGEPLVNPSVIDYISHDMHAWCASKGKSFKFMLQTNGYLLTPELVDRYLPLGLKSVQISLDGVKEEHDLNRPLRGGGGTFDKIIENILASADKVKIGISVSYENGEVEHIGRLLDYFHGLGLLYKLGRFICSPIHPALGPANCPEVIQSAHCLANYEDKKLVRATKRINEMMEAKGLPVRPGLATTLCPLMQEYGGVTIDQEGRIFRCNSMLGHPDMSVGDVRAETFNARQREFRDLDVWLKCPVDCPYLPMCSGGCRLMAFLEKKEFTQPVCKKEYLDQMAPEFIKQDYELILKKKTKDKEMAVQGI